MAKRDQSGAVANAPNIDRLAEQIKAGLEREVSQTQAQADASAPVSTIDQSEAILSDSSPVQPPVAPTIATAPPPAPPQPEGSQTQLQGTVAANANASSPAPTPTTPSPATNLTDFLAALSPEQLAKVRSIANAQGISTGPRKGVNGGLLVEIEIPPEVVEPFATWAESAGEPLAEFIRKIAADSLVSYCFQDWGEAASRGTTPTLPTDTMKPPAAAAVTGA